MELPKPDTEPKMKLYLPGLAELVVLTCVLGVLVFAQRMLNADGDIFRHLSIGRVVLATGNIPTTDFFTHTIPGKAFSPHEWLAGVLFYITWLTSGYLGLVLLGMVLLSLAFWGVFRLCLWRGANQLTAFGLTILGLFPTSLHWIIRPHLFTMVFCVLWLYLVLRYKAELQKLLFFTAMAMLAWVNLHGEFIFGFIVLGAYTAGAIVNYLCTKQPANLREGANLAGAGLLGLVVSLLNPVGWRVWQTMFDFVGNDYLISHTLETQPPEWSDPRYMALIILLGVSGLILLFRWRSFRLGSVFLLGGLVIMTLTSARNVHLLGLVAPVMLAEGISGVRLPIILARMEQALGKYSKSGGSGYLVASILVVAVAVAWFSPSVRAIGPSPKSFPVMAVDWLSEHPQKSNVFNDFSWGGYLAWRLPGTEIFLDSQSDVYGEKLLRDYELAVSGKPEAVQVLDKYSVDWVLVGSGSELGSLLASLGWVDIYEDTTAVILRRP